MDEIKCPKGEIVCVRYYNINGELMFVLTNKPLAEVYFLYEVVNNKLEKLGKAKTPPKLEEMYDVKKKLLKV